MAKIKTCPKPTKKKKRPTITQLKKTLWPIFSKWIRRRDNYTCYTCGKNMLDNPSSCHAGHYVPQSKGNRLRFDERNVHAQCLTCNNFRSGNLSVYALELEAEYGTGILQEFESVKNERKKFTAEELQNMIDDYRQRLKEGN